MLDDRGPESRSKATDGGLRPAPLDLLRLSGLVGDASHRVRALASGSLGALNERQKAAMIELLRLIVHVEELTSRSALPHRIEPEPFDLGTLAADVAGSLRFVAHRRHVTVVVSGQGLPAGCRADPAVARHLLAEALASAIALTPSGSRVHVDLARSGDRLTLDLSAPGWEPALPPAPPHGCGVASSVLRTAAGSRLVFSVPACDAAASG